MRTRRPVPRVTVRPRRRRIARTMPVAPAGPALGVPAGAGAGLPMAGGMPVMKKGGKVKKTGPHMLHKGEKVVPKGKSKKAEHQGMTSGIGAPMKRGKFPPRKTPR